jgi:FHA domain-containing protein
MPNPFDFGGERGASDQDPPPLKPTRLESVEELEKLLDGLSPDSPVRTPTRSAVPRTPPRAAAPSAPPAPPAPAAPPITAFRPAVRPPMALLCVLDDGQDDGEWVRIRTDRFVIGRTEGDLVIPHDTLMSSRHCEISRGLENGAFRWKLIDLGSTNGVYIRVNTKMPIAHGQEMILGSRKYRLFVPVQGVTASDAGSNPEARTQGWQSVNPSEMVPSLVEVTPQGEGQRFFLNPQDNWIGRDRNQCNVVLGNDPLLSPRQLRLTFERRGWQLENHNPVNGCWLRANRVNLGVGGHFQLGEQRFQFKVT